MTHSSTATQILRMHRYVTSTFALLNHAREDFGSGDGPSRLADLLDIPLRQAVDMISGTATGGMHRLAFHYGFMPSNEGPDTWLALPMCQQPFDDGPTMHWYPGMIEYVHEILTAKESRRPSARELAWRMDTTERRLRDALRRRGLRLASTGA